MFKSSKLVYYTRYFGNILILINNNKTTDEEILKEMSNSHPNLEFKLTTEDNDSIHF
jgi:hypothetical protein